MTLHAILSQLVKDLKACPSITVEYAKLGREKTALVARRAHPEWIKSFQFPLEVVRFSPVEPIFLRYTGEVNGSRPFGGEFQLTPVMSTLLSKKDNGLAWEGISAEERAFIDCLKRFDSHPHSGDSRLAAFYVLPGEADRRPEPDIYFFDRGKTFKMALDYAGYVRALADCAAVGGWQYLYLADPIADKSILEILREDLVNLQQLFPQRDWSVFSQRLDERGA